MIQLTSQDFIGILPQLFLLSMAMVILMVGLFVKKDSHATYHLTLFSLLVCLGLTAYVYSQPIHAIFQGGMVLDHLSYLLVIMIYVISAIVFFYSQAYLTERNIPRCEYYVLGLLSIVGMTVLVSAHHFVVLYLALELYSLPIYAMIALHRRQTRCIEAALKYFVMGAVASGFLLYGMSLYFGATGSLDIGTVASQIGQLPYAFHLMLMLGMVFIIAGVVFKLGGVPFHMWVPDVYEGAPACVTLFISAAPKLATFALAARLFLGTSQSLVVNWQPILIAVALLSMLVGNLAAIVQTNLKRMLAYSSIAHMGYMFLGIVAGTRAGYQASLFYMINYALMSAASFGFLVLLSRSGFEAEKIEDLSGLNSRHPWLAFIMLLIMFSLAGIPPLVGFIAKVAVLEALIQAHFVWLAVVALILAVVGAYYYIRVVKVMYFDRVETAGPAIVLPGMTQFVLSLNALATLIIGIFPGALLYLCHLAF